ncbi:MAG: DUF4126 domain-containing protein [Acidobacteriota bacterium]
MDPEIPGTLILQILGGLGLAAAAGLRAFLPPLVAGLLGRLDLVHLRPELEWLQSTPALAVLGAAVLFEVLGDKIPLLDHALDLLGTVLKPASGALALAAPLVEPSPMVAAVTALALGGTVAGAVHVAKSGLRLASTGTTGGLANPILSLGEDILSLGGALVALLSPLLVLVVLVLVLLLLRRVIGRMRSGTRPGET